MIPVIQVDINAPIKLVWQVLTDFDRYPEWNPMILQIQNHSAPSLGAKLKMKVQYPDGSVTHPTMEVTELVEPVEKALFIYSYRGWLSSLGLVVASRRQELIDLGGGRTRYINKEFLGGLLKKYYPFENIEKGMREQIAQLTLRAEALHNSTSPSQTSPN